MEQSYKDFVIEDRQNSSAEDQGQLLRRKSGELAGEDRGGIGKLRIWRGGVLGGRRLFRFIMFAHADGCRVHVVRDAKRGKCCRGQGPLLGCNPYVLLDFFSFRYSVVGLPWKPGLAPACSMGSVNFGQDGRL